MEKKEEFSAITNGFEKTCQFICSRRITKLIRRLSIWKRWPKFVRSSNAMKMKSMRHCSLVIPIISWWLPIIWLWIINESQTKVRIYLNEMDGGGGAKDEVPSKISPENKKTTTILSKQGKKILWNSKNIPHLTIKQQNRRFWLQIKDSFSPDWFAKGSTPFLPLFLFLFLPLLPSYHPHRLSPLSSAILDQSTLCLVEGWSSKDLKSWKELHFSGEIDTGRVLFDPKQAVGRSPTSGANATLEKFNANVGFATNFSSNSETAADRRPANGTEDSHWIAKSQMAFGNSIPKSTRRYNVRSFSGDARDEFWMENYQSVSRDRQTEKRPGRRRAQDDSSIVSSGPEELFVGFQKHRRRGRKSRQ